MVCVAMTIHLQLDECLKAGQTKSDNPQWQLRALQRTTLMVVQRLTRASEPWHEGMIPSVSQLLRLVNERMFPAQSPTASSSQLASDESRMPVIQEQRSEEHTSELQSLMRISYAVFCLKK